MTARPTMESELSYIGARMTRMGELVEASILRAIQSLRDQDCVLAREVIDGDGQIDDLEDDINDCCLKLLATQQPLAGDLRYIISIIHVIRDLERIGDHAEDLAKYTLRFADEVLYKELIDIPRMADLAARMVKNAIDSFVHRDLRLARRVWRADEDVDELFRNLYDELLVTATQNSDCTRQSIMFLFIVAHLERIADYATNICEETVFAREGNHDMLPTPARSAPAN